MPPPFRFLSTAVLAFASLGLAGCQQAYFKALNVPSRDARMHTETYDAARGLALDVYPAQGSRGPVPIVVFLHGGTWQRGRREYYRFVGDALAERGVLVIVPDYRKAPQNPFPAFVEDAAAATAWARAHAAELGGDPSRLFLMGHSSGAHMAAMVGTDRRYLQAWGLQPGDLAGVIGLAGAYDFEPSEDQRMEHRVFRSIHEWARTQPVTFVDGDEPPFLLMHGESDRRVWIGNSESLARRLRAAGSPVTLRLLPGIGHIGLVNGFYSPRFSPALEESLAWMRQRQPVIATTSRVPAPR